MTDLLRREGPEGGSSATMVCATMETSSPGAQTERRGDAGPVRGLLGGKTSPAALLSNQPQRSHAWHFSASCAVHCFFSFLAPAGGKAPCPVPPPLPTRQRKRT